MSQFRVQESIAYMRSVAAAERWTRPPCLSLLFTTAATVACCNTMPCWHWLLGRQISNSNGTQ